MGEVRFWAAKYMLVSWLLGLNIAFFGYHFAFKHIKLYLGLPLTAATFFVSRNLIMRNCMDKIYFPLKPLYDQLKAEEKLSKAAPAPTRTEDYKIHAKIKEQIIQKTAEELAEEEVKREKDEA